MSLWKGKSRGGIWGYKFFVLALRYFGISTAYFFLRFAVIYFVAFSPKAFNSIYFYFREIHQFSFVKSIYKIFQNYFVFGQILIDKIAIHAGFQSKFTFNSVGKEHLMQMLDNKTGGLLISAHVGSWEVAGQLVGNHGNKFNVVIFDAEHERIKKYLSTITADRNYDFIVMHNDLTHIFQIGAALKNYEIVSFQGDRFVDETKTITVNFMGRPAKFPTGPFYIAAKFDVPVLFFFAMKETKKQYKFYFTPAVKNDAFKNHKNREEQVRYMLEQYVVELESIIKKYPEQWLNYYKFWEN